jgi:hypothetical protein
MVGTSATRRPLARQLRTQLEQEVQFDPLQDHARAQPLAPAASMTPTIHAPPAPTAPAEPAPAAMPGPIEPHATPAAMTSNEPKPE